MYNCQVRYVKCYSASFEGIVTPLCIYSVFAVSPNTVFESVLTFMSLLHLPGGQNLTDNVYSSNSYLEAV